MLVSNFFVIKCLSVSDNNNDNKDRGSANTATVYTLGHLVCACACVCVCAQMPRRTKSHKGRGSSGDSGGACFYCWEHLTNHFPTVYASAVCVVYTVQADVLPWDVPRRRGWRRSRILRQML
ncbi:hypothetical protein QTP88_005290 [Uroleucon formosanum]